MGETSVEEVMIRVLDALSQAHARRGRALIIIRCSGRHEVDHARESLLHQQAPVPWKILPAAELDPPDLIGYVLSKARPQGPAFLVYGLPQGRDRHVLRRFLELIEIAERKYVMAPFLMVMMLTLDELRDLAQAVPAFWKSKSDFVSWPVDNAAERFVPARMGASPPARRGGRMAAFGAGVSGIGGGLEGAAGIAESLGNPLVDGTALSDSDFGLAPWVGAPFKAGDAVPRYIAHAAPPAGRRWGRQLVPDDGQGANLIDRCRQLLDQHATEFARQGLSKAVKHFRAANNAPATAECYVLLARASELRFDHTVALEWYDQALDLYDHIGDHAGVSDCCAMIGYLRFTHGDLDGAFAFFDRGLHRDEEAGDQLRMASGYRRIGIVLEQRREYGQALTLYRKAGDIERENEDRYAYARSLHHQARPYQRKDKFEDAEELLAESLKIKEELEDIAGLGTGYHELGNLHLRKQALEDALDAYRRALEFEEQLQDVHGLAVTHAQLGLVLTRTLSFVDGTRAFMIARELFHRLQSPYEAVMENALKSANDTVASNDLEVAQAEAREYIEKFVTAT